MPRTKVVKNTKRNRNASIREEKLSAYELKMDAYAMNVEELGFKYVAQVDTQLKLIMSAMSTKLLQMKMNEFFQLQLRTTSDYKTVNESICNKTVSTMDKELIRHDEGYLTEDSSTGAVGLHALPAPTALTDSKPASTGELLQSLPSPRAMRTLGPLHSARARRGLRSRSACEEPVVPGSAKPKPRLPGAVVQAHSEHSSRSKLRTPVASRTKAFSTERTPSKTIHCDRGLSPSSPPFEFLRWPKPGEIVLSKCGTPILTQVKPDSSANVNIPIKDGILSLRPRKLEQLAPNFIENIDTETLQQIKTLGQNLKFIMKMAEKVSLK